MLWLKFQQSQKVNPTFIRHQPSSSASSLNDCVPTDAQGLEKKTEKQRKKHVQVVLQRSIVFREKVSKKSTYYLRNRMSVNKKRSKGKEKSAPGAAIGRRSKNYYRLVFIIL